MGIAGLFLLGFLLLLLFGARTYRGAVEGQSRNDRSRALLAYLSATVKNNDGAGAVHVEENAETGQTLVVEDGYGYAFRIYQREGRLWEDYAAVGSGLNPGSARAVGETRTFRIERGESGLLTVTTDAGRVLLAPRSAGED